MAKPGALLLLLAVAASLVDIQSAQIVRSGEKSNYTMDISNCTIHFFGREFSMIDVFFKQDSTIAVCFKNNTNDAAQDCISLPDRNSTKLKEGKLSFDRIPLQSAAHRSLPGIMFPSVCQVGLIFEDQAGLTMPIFFIKFGVQAAVKVPTYNHSVTTMEAWVANKSVKSVFINDTAAPFFLWDITGCRVSGEALPARSEMIDRETCSKVKCNNDTTITTESTCQPLQECRGNNMCHLPSVLCTVTGPNVIDFFGRVQTVTDRCGYSLLRLHPTPKFEILAVFRERRRRDVPFLDHLILKINSSSDNFYLEQAGRVRKGETTLSLGSTPLDVAGVYFSVDQTGVTARLPGEDIKVVFDGNTAHVLAKKQSLAGLCGNPINSTMTPTMAAERALSSPGCQAAYSDISDATINCNLTAAHCQFMNQAPFTACHNHINPSSFIEACSKTSCIYPAKDGFHCQHFEAYAKSCSLLPSGVTVQNWRSKAGCSAVSQGFCPDEHCSDHEFCGGYPPRCLCRAIFASKYKPTNSFGEPTICTQNTATVTLAGCLLQDKGVQPSHLHLNDKNCTGDFDRQTHMLTFSFDSSNACGTEVAMNRSHAIFKNRIMVVNSSTDVISRESQFILKFSCFYRMPDVQSVSFKIKDSSIMQQIVSGFWNYTLMMNAYTDPRHMYAVKSDTEIRLNQRIWLELKTEGLDDKLVTLVTDSCWATNQPAPDSSLKYNLIINGCSNPADDTVKVIGNGLGTSNSFSFNMFEFFGGSSDIYLHCKMELCVTASQSCAPRCSGVKRKRRSARRNKAQVSGSAAVITMTWNN